MSIEQIFHYVESNRKRVFKKFSISYNVSIRIHVFHKFSTTYMECTSVVSTRTLTNKVSSFMYWAWLPFSKLWATKRGHPDAMFMSVEGFLKLDEVGSGLKVSDKLFLRGDWSRSIKVTLYSKGHLSIASYSPLMTTKNNDKCVFLPMPSPFK